MTPPQKSYLTTQEPSSQSSAEVYQPNGWTTYNGDKEPRNLGDYFSNEFIGLYKSSTQEPENNDMDFLIEMDQFVPVTNTSINLQFHTRFGQSTVVNKVEPNNLIQNDLERLDDYFLADDVDSEACRRLLQELNTTSS